MSLVALTCFLAPTLFSASVRAQDAEAAPAPRARLTPRLRPRPTSPPPAQSQPPAAQPAPAAQPTPATQPAAPAPATPAPTPAATTQLPGDLDLRPPLLPAYKNLPPPPGYVARNRFNRGAFWGGVSMFTLSYTAGVFFGAANNFEDGLGLLGVPVVGPWLALSKRDFTCDVGTVDLEDQSVTSDCEEKVGQEVIAGAVLAGLGIGQLAGTSLIILGLADRKKTWLRADLAGISMRIAPRVGPSQAGFLAYGSF